MGDVITWVIKRSAFYKTLFKITQCALNRCNIGILGSRVTTVFKIESSVKSSD